MSEFENRIEAQRAILKTVNQYTWPKEPLFSLTYKSINRWIVQNHLEPESSLSKLVLGASEKLFFLANKSQEQITEDYRNLSKNVSQIHSNISQEIINLHM